jgi:hypothetical protein
MSLEEFARYLLRRHHNGEGEIEHIETPELEVENLNLTDGE